ncbi:MAG: MATE family efflux transporter, partial [Oscillospiraceae bacterium]|nr:MATE family efflux transporter [Oscillospiraceae bacterium]
MYSARDLRKLMIPFMIQEILVALMGTVDTLMVSNIGAAAISGVSLVDSVNKLVNYLFLAVSTGGTIICSQYLGQHNAKSSNRVARQMLLSALVLSLAIMTICLISCNSLLSLIFGQVEPDVMASAQTYLLITAVGYPFSAVFSASSAVFRASGNSRLPMIISVCSNIFNIFGNYVALFVLKWGVAGAALSTVISQLGSAVAMLIFLRRGSETIDIGTYHSIRPDGRMIWLIISVGFPTAIENAMFQFGKLMVQSTVSTLGTAAISANAIVVVLELLTSEPSIGICFGLMTVVGHCIGAGKPDEARKYIKKMTLVGFVVLFIFNWLIFFVTKPITVIAGMEGESASLTLNTMLVISILKPMLWPLAFVPSYGMKAAGDVKFTMIASTATM